MLQFRGNTTIEVGSSGGDSDVKVEVGKYFVKIFHRSPSLS